MGVKMASNGEGPRRYDLKLGTVQNDTVPYRYVRLTNLKIDHSNMVYNLKYKCLA